MSELKYGLGRQFAVMDDETRTTSLKVSRYERIRIAGAIANIRTAFTGHQHRLCLSLALRQGVDLVSVHPGPDVPVRPLGRQAVARNCGHHPRVGNRLHSHRLHSPRVAMGPDQAPQVLPSGKRVLEPFGHQHRDRLPHLPTAADGIAQTAGPTEAEDRFILRLHSRFFVRYSGSSHLGFWDHINQPPPQRLHHFPPPDSPVHQDHVHQRPGRHDPGHR